MIHILELKLLLQFKERRVNKLISLIAAMDKNNVIGYKNDMPWSLPNDLKHFKNVTSHSTIIMGRKTYESIGRPLPNRRNIILSRSGYETEDVVEVISSIEEKKKQNKTKNQLKYHYQIAKI